ncbi:MAG: metal-independent alpha-mannosidase [[Chlorobium] sp. 445]|nr:MAG: metal-independent alpha-mannosidase [[Chlorobium] sp. 445]
MHSRRKFLKATSLALAGWAAGSAFMAEQTPDAGNQIAFKSRRPEPPRRTFHSEAIEAKIEEMKKLIADKELAWLFENCFPNTLDTTVQHHGMLEGKLDTFIITGDIAAMWLRDSTAQLTPYIPLCKAEKKLADLIKGVINRQTRCVLIDPYANAFNYDNREPSRWHQDKTAMRNELHERKWEIDSLCYVIRLAYLYWKATDDASFMDKSWQTAMKIIYDVFREQQRMQNDGSYRFKREFAAWYGDCVANDGLGLPTRKIGLIHSTFRPSDDACLFPLLIPSNFFATVSLRQLAEMAEAELNNPAFASACRTFADELEHTLEQYAKREHLHYGPCYAFETDGYSNYYFMDDGNLPSLISLPYLGCLRADEPTYLNTRRFILSEDHMYFFKGKAGEGYGGPHAGWEMIWHLGILAVALTATHDDEIVKQLRLLKTTHAGTGFMHEAFHKDDARKFTRAWFAWANSLFGELILKLHTERAYLLRKEI